MKKERTQGFVSGILASALVFSLVGTAAATIGSRTLTADYNDIKIELNGQQLTPTDAAGNPVEPFAVNGTTYLPVRAVGNALGMDVDWDGATSTVLLEADTSNTYDAQACKDNLIELDIYRSIEDALEYGELILDSAHNEMAYVGHISSDKILSYLNEILSEQLPLYESQLSDIDSKIESAKETCQNDVVLATLDDFAASYLRSAYGIAVKLRIAIDTMTEYTENPTDANWDIYTEADTAAFTAINELHLSAHKQQTNSYHAALRHINSLLPTQ